ncbi:MAG: gliding motility-associated C-terminal domain-containing protein, partial [Bacteroidota bacterium]
IVVPDMKLIIPNAFSPNGDGVQDTWNIPALISFPNAIVKVFNRWGELVFSSNGIFHPWDGTFNGSKLPSGAYAYYLQAKPGEIPYTGWVLIMR